MQVVGKVQGTRRLPPPAWVPSIKAETGGLDSRVSIVPPGGGPQSDAPQTDKVNTHGAVAALTNATTAVTTESLSQPTAWTSRAPTTVASGGLAANKPFFQRPPPVTSSTTTSTTSSKPEERKPSSTQAGGGASEIVGEPTGWAAITEEEPNFDERILFSDDEESQEDSKSTLKSSVSARIATQSDANTTTGASIVVPPSKQSAPVLGSFNEPEPVSHTEPSRPFSSAFGGMSSSVYDEPAREKVSDAWSNTDSSSTFAAYNAPPVSRHPNTLPFANSALGAHCSVGSESDRALTIGQYMQHPIQSQGVNPSFPDSYFPSAIPPNRMASSGGLLDSILPPTDADTELQNAQRQARTQEFRSAVERARISRQQREVFSTEDENLLQKSVVNLISESCDSSHTHATQAPTQSMLLSPGHPVVPPVISGVIPQQLLLPGAYPQGAGQNRPSLAAAAAAATAAAMVCGAGGAPTRLGTPGAAPNLAKIPHSQPLPVSSHSAVNMVGSWQGPGTLPPNIPTTGFTNPKPPTVPQVLQSALSMATSAAPGAHPNGVFLNPDFFVERLLEILNQQQVVRPQSTPQSSAPSRTLLQPTETVAPTSTHEQGRLLQPGSMGTPSKGTFSENQFNDSDLTELSQQIESTLKTESPTSMQNVAPSISEQTSVASSTGKQQTQQQQVKRVPMLMDVKVPTSTSRNLAHLWEQDDYLSGPSGRGGRGRSKLFSAEKSRGGSGDHRGAVNPIASHEDYDGSSNVRSWHSKNSRRVFNGPKPEQENPLTNSDIQLEVTHSSRSDAKPSYGSEPEEYTTRAEGFHDDPSTSNRRYDPSSGSFEAGNTNRQISGTSKQRNKPAHNDAQEGESNGQRRTDYSRQHDRVRRGRGGSGFYYSSSSLMTVDLKFFLERTTLRTDRVSTAMRLSRSRIRGLLVVVSAAEATLCRPGVIDLKQVQRISKAQEKPASYELPVEDYDEGDLPTVRVPPMDTAFKSSRTHYTRGHRSATFQRGGLRRIASSRTSGTQQQQTKRSTGSNIQGSRRYRDSQNRFRDDKDGDGGAAAGGGSGTGRSTMGGDGANTYGSGGSSGTNGCNELGDNQNGGGSRNKGSSNDSAHDGNDRLPNSQIRTAEKSCPTDAESNDNNTASSSADVSRPQRQVPAARGTVGDACDAEEWETATEGSSDPESASSNPGTRGNLTIRLSNHTDDSVTVCTDSKPVVSESCAVQSMASGSLSVHYGDTNVADCASRATSLSSTMVISSALNSAIGSAALGHELTQASGSGRAGCHLYEHDKYPHDRRGSGGGSGGLFNFAPSEYVLKADPSDLKFYKTDSHYSLFRV
ncbi:unnamed protein product [Echinostoma caproni]|uniref:BAT2_N domain-containing protein n=1 Tax=Echinostoma caproni TaxID=27848 RepID=A0A183AMQ2_9TREM|nr:unnamed protein product [Echinostoma caproni]